MISDVDKALFDLSRPRWPLPVVLLWIATRDEVCAALGCDLDIPACNLALEIGQTHYGLANNKSASAAWSDDLVLALDGGKIKTSAVRVFVNRLGFEQVTPGVVFPPENQPFSASTHEFFELSRNDGFALRPMGSNLVSEWVEWRDLTFSRAEVLKLWSPQKGGHRDPVSDDDIRSALLKFKEKIGRIPTARDWTEFSFGNRVPKGRVQSVIRATFGTRPGRPYKNVPEKCPGDI